MVLDTIWSNMSEDHHRLGEVAHAFNPRTWRGWRQEFKARMVYRTISITTRATKKPYIENNNKKKATRVY